MALFDSAKRVQSSLKKVRPTVVKTDNVAKELTRVATEYGIKPESLDFNLLDVQTFTKLSDDPSQNEWKEIDNETLHEIDNETLLNPNFHIKQTYEIEIFSRSKGKNPLEGFHIAIGANATKCKVYMKVKEGSKLEYFPNLKKELEFFINKHKVRAGILIYIFDEILLEVVSQLAAKTQIEEILFFDSSETFLIASCLEPTPTITGELILHYEEKQDDLDENKRIDYANRGFLQSVSKDELLMEYIKPKAGKPGRDCRGRYIEAKEPSSENGIEFEVDEESIYIKEDDESIKFYAKENGYIAFEDNTYKIKSEADVDQVSFKTTGSITVGLDSDVNLVVTEKDAIKDAIGVGMEVEVTEIEVEGNVGSEAKVKAHKAIIGGQTHKTSFIEADEAQINVHKGTAKGKKIKITRLEHGIVEGEEIYVSQAMGGRIFGENIKIGVCTSYVKVRASHRIEIKRMRGSENIFTIDPLQQKKTKESFKKNQEKIDALQADIKKLKREIESYTALVKKNLPILNDIKKRLLHYKKSGIKLPEAFVKQYKVYQAQIDKLKAMKEELKSLEEKYNLLTNQTDSLQYNILDARVINRDRWIGYNEIRAKLIDPPMELVYKPQENEPHSVYGIIELGNGEFAIKPIDDEEKVL